MGSIVNMGGGAGEVKRAGNYATLQSLSLASRAVDRALNRREHLPGLVVLHAPYGSGKSVALSYIQNRHDGFYLTCASHFTRKAFTLALLREMGVAPGRTVSEMMEQVALQLDKCGRPVILDDVHRIGNPAVLSLILDIHQAAHTTIVLAGDEHFPAALQRADGQIYSRVLAFQALPPVSAADARELARFYCPGIEVADDLLQRLREKTRGNARLICVNLDDVRHYCMGKGLKRIDLAGWGRHGVFGGTAAEQQAVA